MSDAAGFLAALKAKTDPSLGLTDWFSYDQQAIDNHAKTTGDDGPVHNDPDYCKAHTPFGGTIVQGSLLMSTLTRMAKSLEWPDGEMVFRLSYGYNKVRIIQPIKTDQRFRGRFRLKDAEAKGNHALLITVDITLEGEGDDSPAIAAEWLFYVQFAS